jgi:hypothetical protein
MVKAGTIRLTRRSAEQIRGGRVALFRQLDMLEALLAAGTIVNRKLSLNQEHPRNSA